MQRAVADRRWAKLTAAGGSLALLGMFTFLAELFMPSKSKVIYAQQTLRSGDPLNIDRDLDVQNPYRGRVTLPHGGTPQEQSPPR